MTTGRLTRRTLLGAAVVAVPCNLLFGASNALAQETEATIEVTIAPTEPVATTEPTEAAPEPSPTATPTPTATAAAATTPTPVPTPSPEITTAPTPPGSGADGGVIVSIHSVELGSGDALPYATSSRIVPVGLELEVTDSRSGPSLGWSVALAAGSFEYEGAGFGSAIPAENLVIANPGIPILIQGQEINDRGPFPVTASINAALHIPRTVLACASGGGKGTYRQRIDLTLTVPAFARPGIYRGVLLTTANSAP